MASFWDTITAPFTGAPMEDAAAARARAIATGQQQLEEQYAAGRGAVANQYTQALQPYMALQPTAQGGYQAYADASGAAGREGQLRAQQAFTTDPGYEFAQRQMEDAVQRAGVAGGVGIGTRTADIMDRTQGLASRAYGDYVNRLAPWLGQSLGIAGGMAGIETGLGGELSRSYAGQGDAALRAQTGIGEANAYGAMAPMAAGSNIWGGVLNLGKAALGSPGAMSAIGGGISSLFGPKEASLGGSPETNPLLRPLTYR